METKRKVSFSDCARKISMNGGFEVAKTEWMRQSPISSTLPLPTLACIFDDCQLNPIPCCIHSLVPARSQIVTGWVSSGNDDDGSAGEEQLNPIEQEPEVVVRSSPVCCSVIGSLLSSKVEPLLWRGECRTSDDETCFNFSQVVSLFSRVGCQVRSVDSCSNLTLPLALSLYR